MATPLRSLWVVEPDKERDDERQQAEQKQRESDAHGVAPLERQGFVFKRKLRRI